MTIEVRVPALPESVSDGVVAGWHKQPGDEIQRDEALVDIETDKVVLEIPAPDDGVLEKILLNNGDTVVADQVIGLISREAATTVASATQAVAASGADSPENRQPDTRTSMGPAARKIVAEHGLDPGRIAGTGRDGRVTKADVLDFMNARSAGKPRVGTAPAATTQPPHGPAADTGEQPAEIPQPTPGLPEIEEERPQKRVPMTRLRARVAERLLHATRNTAMLTTFNEVNMQPVMELRARYKDEFESIHGVRLGIMSFFVRAAAEALKRHPDINASIDGDDIVYHGFCDIGVAISSERGLVVPILRNAEYMSLAEIETGIVEFASKAQDKKLEMEDITGGTFTISNGGVFGSMLSTPILNPPQSAILGMHKIQERPVAEHGKVVIRPVMYVALTYDHRMVDGKSAVTFLVTIKELLEDPASMLLDI
jgi:2-oxoglutarate dehydrogenase E2 component (dihydrolipoamide succinyltransferase)